MDVDDKLDMALDDFGGGKGGRGGKGGGRGLPRGQKRNRGDDSGPIQVGRRIYVGNLSWKTTWMDLKDHFRQVGTVAYADVMREGGDQNGRSRGCGIVEFERAEEAAAAINTMNNLELMGRQVFVREDREDRDLVAATQQSPKRTRGPPSMSSKPFSMGAHGEYAKIGRRVYVMNLSWETSWQTLKDHFRQVGNVVYADVMKEGDRSKGCGIVEFEHAEEALQAIVRLSNSTLDDRQILVREDREDRYLQGGSGGGKGSSSRGPPSRGSAGAGGSRGGGDGGSGAALVVQNLPWSTSWQDLKDLFKKCGHVVRADVMSDQEGKSKGFGTVVMSSSQEANQAIQMFNQYELDGRALAVKYDKFAS